MALGLGVNLVQTRLLGLLAIALLCGAAVAVAGPIGFVGLVVPHVVRRLVTEDIRPALPAAPVGALALVLADIAARTLVAPQELATGAMTAGGCAVVYLYRREVLNDARRSPGRFSAAGFRLPPAAAAPGGVKIAASIVLTLLALGLYSLGRGSYPLPASTLARPAGAAGDGRAAALYSV